MFVYSLKLWSPLSLVLKPKRTQVNDRPSHLFSFCVVCVRLNLYLCLCKRTSASANVCVCNVAAAVVVTAVAAVAAAGEQVSHCSRLRQQRLKPAFQSERWQNEITLISFIADADVFCSLDVLSFALCWLLCIFLLSDDYKRQS